MSVPMATATTWFVAVAGKDEPLEISAETLQTLDPDALVWRDGLSEWVPVRSVTAPQDEPSDPYWASDAAKDDFGTPSMDGADSGD